MVGPRRVITKLVVIAKLVDHLFVNGKWVRSITNCRSYSSIELSANLKIRLKKFKQTPSGRKIGIENPEILKKYQLELKNCLDWLREVEDPEAMYKDIVEIVGETAQKMIGNPPNCGPKLWVSDATLILVPNRDNEKKRYRQKKTTATKDGKVLQSKCKSLTLRISGGSWKSK